MRNPIEGDRIENKEWYRDGGYVGQSFYVYNEDGVEKAVFDLDDNSNDRVFIEIGGVGAFVPGKVLRDVAAHTGPTVTESKITMNLEGRNVDMRKVARTLSQIYGQRRGNQG